MIIMDTFRRKINIAVFNWVGSVLVEKAFLFFIYFSLLSKYVYCIYSNCNSSQDVAVS